MAYPFKNLQSCELRALKTHKYKCVDNSILQNLIFGKVFSAVQKCIPSFITPNQLTIFGFISMLSSFILTFIFDRTLENAPRVLPLLNLILLIIYFLADGVDGIHARSTNQCSPLGQLLDHGVDSCVCLFLSTATASSLELGMGSLFLLFLINIFSGFYFGELHEKYVGFFKFNYVSGCSEGIAIVSLIHLFSFLMPGTRFVCSGNFILFNIHFTKNMLFYLFLVPLVFNCVEFLISVLKVIRGTRIREFIFSILRLLLLYIVFIIGFSAYMDGYILRNWILMSVFSNSFSLCYIEETLSMVLKGDPDLRVFLYSLVVLICAALFGIFKVAYFKMMYLILGFSILHFLIRHGSIISDLCEKLGFKFLFKK